MQTEPIKNIIITGARSYTAKNLIPLLDGSYHITQLGKKDFFSEQAKKNLAQADCIIHLAHSNDADTNKDISHFIVDNISKSCRLIYLSSIAVYGDKPHPRPIQENDDCQPNTDNGVSKRQAENIIKAHNNHLILRVPQIYGEGIKKYAVGAIYNKLCAHQPIEITDNGKLYRDFIHVDELANLIKEQVRQEITGIYNVGTGKAVTLYDFALHLKASLKSQSNITCTATQTNSTKWAVPDVTKAKRELGVRFSPLDEIL